MINEEWRQITSFPRYQASSLGFKIGHSLYEEIADAVKTLRATAQPVTTGGEKLRALAKRIETGLNYEEDSFFAPPLSRAEWWMIASSLQFAALPANTAGDGRPTVSIKPMQLSDNRTDYFVSIKVGDREVTPHVFREEYKAAYHVALYDWLLNGSGEEPDCVEFGPDDWPARVLSTPTPAPAVTGDVRSIEKILNDHFWTGEPGQHEAIKAALAALSQQAPATDALAVTRPDR